MDIETLQKLGDDFIENQVGSENGTFEIRFNGDIITFYFKSAGYPDETTQCVLDAVRMLGREDRFNYRPRHVLPREIVLEKCKSSENEEFFKRDENGDYINPEF